MQLSLSLFGPFQATWAGQPISFTTSTVRALLGYLAVDAGRPHARELVAALFWPDQSQAGAYANLRQTLARVRKTLPDPSDVADFLTITTQTLQFDRTAAEIDVARFEELLAECAVHSHVDPSDCPACLERLRQAAALYRGEFLQGLFLPQSQSFEEWLLLKRESLHRQALDVLHMLTESYERTGDYTQMRDYAARQLALEPWREEAHMAVMRALAFVGDRSAALAQYETCRRVLGQELGIEPSVETRALYEQIQAGSLTPAARATAPPHNLPASLTPLIGRDAELAELSALGDAPEVRLLTLVGAGGMGKTRLALEAARARIAAFPDGVFVVWLAPLAAATAIAPAIAAALGVTVHGNPREAVLQTLHDKQMLLILDNFEHVLDGAEIVVEILQAAPRLEIIATSRERINVRGEHLFFVQGLQYALDTRPADAAAVRLFVQSARRVQPRYTLSETNLPVIQRICELVEGMPLGLELAAAWADTLPLDTIAAEIARSADFLKSDWRDVPERQRSMRAVFDWSWALLDETEQQVFKHLSVFRGGFTRDAAHAVVGASLRTLTRLVQKSLLHWGASRDGAGRYAVHELLRQLAAELLDAAPDERAAVEARHSAFYLAFVAERAARLTGSAPREAAAEIREEIDNVRMAWTWAAHQARLPELDQSAWALRHFYSLSGLHAEGEQLFRLAVAHLQAHREQARRDDTPRPDLDRVLSKLLALYANALVTHRAFDQALSTAQQAVSLGSASGSIEGEVLGYLFWGQALAYKSDYPEARSHLEEALRLACHHQLSVGPLGLLRFTEYSASILLGNIATHLGDYAEARNLIHRSLHICESLGDARGEITCLIQLAHIAEGMRDEPAALQNYERALHLARPLGDRWAEATAYIEIGDLARSRGEYGRALALIERGLMIVHEMGDDQAEAIALARLGRLYSYLGAYGRARELLDHSLGLSQKVGARLVEAVGLLCRALLAHQTGAEAQALADAAYSRQIAEEVGSGANRALALIVLGHAQAGLQRLAEATASYQQAMVLCDAMDNSQLATETRAGLASVALAEGDRARALEHVEAILPLLVEDSRAGLDEPFYVYLVCYRALAAVDDPRAVTVLQTGQRLVDVYAHDITDPTLRHTFLNKVATHRELLLAAARVVAPSDRGRPEQTVHNTVELAMHRAP